MQRRFVEYTQENGSFMYEGKTAQFGGLTSEVQPTLSTLDTAFFPDRVSNVKRPKRVITKALTLEISETMSLNSAKNTTSTQDSKGDNDFDCETPTNTFSPSLEKLRLVKQRACSMRP